MTNYVGHDLTTEECEKLRIAFVDPKLSDKEAALFSSKWFDYRDLHPIRANYLFAHHYERAARAALRRRVDVFRAVNSHFWGRKKLYGAKGQKLKKDAPQENFMAAAKRTVTGIIKARQAADRNGIPYYHYCRSGMHYAEKMKWRFVPKPFHLHSDRVKKDVNGQPIESIVDWIERHWKEYQKTHFVVAEQAFFRAENYTDHPYQRAHLKYVLMQLHRSKHPIATTSQAVYELGLLKPEWVINSNKLDGISLLRQAENFYHNTKGEDLCTEKLIAQLSGH